MKKVIFILGLITCQIVSSQTFIAGFDFTDQSGTVDVADFNADVAGSQVGVSLDTNAFIQGSAFNGSALALEARQVGFDTIGNAPASSDFDGQNGFSSDPFGLFFQGAINDLSFTIDVDTSSFNEIDFGYDSFSDDTGIQSGGEWFTSFDGGSDVSLETVSFTDSYSETSYSINTTGIDSLALTFRFDSLEQDTNGAGVTGQRVHFDNFAVGGTQVPEPSTYAAIVGVFALAFTIYRRRRI